jgi:hypothetical protein
METMADPASAHLVDQGLAVRALAFRRLRVIAGEEETAVSPGQPITHSVAMLRRGP